MSKRLQVLFEDREYNQLAKAARLSGLSLGEWVRQQLRNSLAARSEKDSATKMAKVLELAHKHAFPSGSIEEIKNEIKTGYLKK